MTTIPSPADFRTETIESFLAQLALARPSPGGGSATALAAATAAALVSKVCGVSARDSEAAGIARERVVEADRVRSRLLELMEADARAFQDVIAARRRRPAAHDADVQDRLRTATAVPLEIAQRGADVLRLCEDLARVARRSVVADLGVAARLACGAVEAAGVTVRENASELVDTAYARSVLAQVDRLIEDGRGALRSVEAGLADRARR